MKNTPYNYLPSLLLLALCLLTGCHGRSSSSASDSDSLQVAASTPADTLHIRYAEGFRIDSEADGTFLLDIHDPQHPQASHYRFRLIPPTAHPRHTDGIPQLRIPVGRAICMTSLQLSNFIKLDALDHVSGITSARHLFNEDVKARVADGRIMRIGFEGEFDSEVILAAAPDVVLISPFKRGGYDALKDGGIPLIPHLGYKELTPLGQAEWLKLVGLLTGKASEANALFDSIAARYDRLCALTADADERPVVLSGDMKGGNWYAQGGRSFMARLINDAGARYFLHDNDESGGVTLDFETVYAMAESADFWRINNSHRGTFTYDDLRDLDARYADFRAFRLHHVIYCNMSQRPFYEAMPVEPDAVLADLIHAFHPELLPHHTPRFYQLLP